MFYTLMLMVDSTLSTHHHPPFEQYQSVFIMYLMCKNCRRSCHEVQRTFTNVMSSSRLHEYQTPLQCSDAHNVSPSCSPPRATEAGWSSRRGGDRRFRCADSPRCSPGPNHPGPRAAETDVI